jgi:hypothetical protein
MEDPDLLDGATSLGRVLLTSDKDFLAEGASRQAASQYFAGIVYMPQRQLSDAQCIADLTLIALAGRAVDLANRVTFLPLR